METAACVAFRTYHDAIHGIIRIPTVLCTHFVDTPAFRRLSRIHQLGNAHMVFPSATHTRFAHSLGVCWLAGEYFEAVHRNSGRPVAPEELMMVQLAGLMHDVGHGCFSHTLDRIASRWDIHWCHEHMSVAILQRLASEPSAERAMAECGVHIPTVCEMILGAREKAPADWEWRGPATGHEYMYEIVANAVSGVDVDRMDYFLRDGAACDLGIHFNYRALLAASRLQYSSGSGSVHIAHHVNQRKNIEDMFRTRAALHEAVYQSPEIHARDVLVEQALCAADPVIGLSEALRLNSTRFITLTDDLLGLIRYLGGFSDFGDGLGPDVTGPIRQAAAIVRKLDYGNLPVCLYRWTFPSEWTADQRRLQCESVKFCYERENPGKEAHVFLFPIHFGSGEEDPMHTLRWYGSVYNTDSRIHEEPAACVANAADCAVAAAAPAPTPLFTWPSQFCEWQVQVFITSK